MAKVGVVLSGCGYLDGAEIYESVLTLRCLSKENADYICMAPRVEQKHVLNHVTGQDMDEMRNVYIEASRLARGKIEPVEDIEERDLSAIIFPGGYGAAKNLSTFAFDGIDCQVLPEIERIITQMFEAGKPIGAICIAPLVVARVLQGQKLRLTLGMDSKMKAAVEALGHEHADCDFDEICVDESHKIISTPAYMVAESIAEADAGIEKLVKMVLNFSQAKSVS